MSRDSQGKRAVRQLTRASVFPDRWLLTMKSKYGRRCSAMDPGTTARDIPGGCRRTCIDELFARADVRRGFNPRSAQGRRGAA
ncbi:MAG: hypothetical protein ABI379_00135 [Rhodanobacter sp.]